VLQFCDSACSQNIESVQRGRKIISHKAGSSLDAGRHDSTTILLGNIKSVEAGLSAYPVGRRKGIIMRISYFLFITSLIVSGCASTVELKSADDARSKIGNRSAMIHLKSGQEYIGRYVQVGSDSVLLVKMDTDDTLQFSNRDVEFMKVINHKVGSGEGLLIGGASLGALIMILNESYDSNEEGHKKLPPIITAIGAGIGGAIGLAIGSMNGHHYTYILPKDTLKDRKGISIDSTNSSNQKILKSAP
jgi:hypothetical protein